MAISEDMDQKPEPGYAWNLVDEANRLETISRARVTGRTYLPFHRSMLAAVVSARAGDRPRTSIYGTAILGGRTVIRAAFQTETLPGHDSARRDRQEQA